MLDRADAGDDGAGELLLAADIAGDRVNRDHGFHLCCVQNRRPIACGLAAAVAGDMMGDSSGGLLLLRPGPPEPKGSPVTLPNVLVGRCRPVDAVYDLLGIAR